MPRTSLARTSLPKRTSITPNPVHSTGKIGILKSHASYKSPTVLKNVQSDKLKSNDSRVKSIEENSIQESRLSTIEAALSQLRADNIDLQLTVKRLKSDIESSQFVVSQLCATEANFKEVEDRCIRLSTENENLTVTLAELRTSINQQADNLILAKTAEEEGITFEQQKLNSNVVIRGVDVSDEVSESELKEVFNKILDHIGVLNTEEFSPASAQLIRTNKQLNSKLKPANIIQIKLSSVTAKRKFLQTKRLKKSITPSDIGCQLNSRKPLLITEQLTKANQNLLYQARSLRGTNKFKFVWSSNGQILARQKPNSKVIRIKDVDHVNRLRAAIDGQPLNIDGQHNTGKPVFSNSNQSQVRWFHNKTFS